MRFGQNVKKDEVKIDNFRINRKKKTNNRNKEYFVTEITNVKLDTIVVIGLDPGAKTI